MTAFDTCLDWFGRSLGAWLRREVPGEAPFVPSDPAALRRTLRPADVLLVSGSNQLSTAIKYLTQSTWSHAALYVGDALEAHEAEADTLIEVNLGEGCVAVPLSKYDGFHTRICRPVGLTDADREAVVAYMASHLGTRYDMRNVVDLARYLLPTPPVPTRWRRRMIALGSGEPTRAICSTLIAAAFQHVRYPILPRVERIAAEKRGMTEFQRQEILHIRHHSLYTPADFDLSPYFRVVKPTIEEKFDYRQLRWAHAAAGSRERNPMRRPVNPSEVVVVEQAQRVPRRRPAAESDDGRQATATHKVSKKQIETDGRIRQRSMGLQQRQADVRELPQH